MSEAATAPAPACIEARDLGVRFGELDVFQEMSFLIRTGEFISLLGPSGCGKSTLLRVIAKLISATAGTIEFGAHSGQYATPSLRLGIVFQKPLLLPWRTTLENVLLPVELERRGNAVDGTDTARAMRAIALTRLSGFENVYPHQLSGGMQQRAALARALMSDPEILLMDEPFGALDELTREVLNEEVLRIWRSGETRLSTVVMVTHSIPEAVAMSDRIFVLGPRPARLVEAVAVRLNHPRNPDGNEFAGRVAYVRKLVRSLA